MKSVEKGFELAGICNVPYIEASKEIVDEFIASAIAALDSQADTGNELAAECKAILAGRVAGLAGANAAARGQP